MSLLEDWESQGCRLDNGSHWHFKVKRLDDWLRRFPEVYPRSLVGWGEGLATFLWACCLATDLRPPAKRTPSYTCEAEPSIRYHRQRLTPLRPTSLKNSTGVSQVLVQVCLETELWADIEGTHSRRERTCRCFPSGSFRLEASEEKRKSLLHAQLRSHWSGEHTAFCGPRKQVT